MSDEKNNYPILISISASCEHCIVLLCSVAIRTENIITVDDKKTCGDSLGVPVIAEKALCKPANLSLFFHSLHVGAQSIAECAAQMEKSSLSLDHFSD